MGRGQPEERKRRTPRSWTEQDMSAALVDIAGGTSVRDAALKWKIPLQTLRDRKNGRTKSYRRAHGGQQVLTPEGEAVLVAWLQLWADTARPVSISRVQRIARDLAGGKVGKNWVYRFLERHPELKLGKPSGLDPKRAQAFNEPTVTYHFEQLKKALYPGLKPSNLYNMDEKGCQRGGGRRIRNQKFIICNGKLTQYRVQSANLELITIIECVSADGTHIKPGFIFPQKKSSLEEEWINVDPEIGIATTAKGWTDNVTCYEWFTKTFIPQATARREDPEETIVLVMDRHGSHDTSEMLAAALKHNIEFHFLPPHTTHQLQPLDVGIFGPLQRKWQERCDEFISETNAEVPRSHFVKEYMDVRNEVFTLELIQLAWKKTGIWPLNPRRFTEKDFAPSKLLSYTTCLPRGYPELPDAPDVLTFGPGSNEDRGEGGEAGDSNESMGGVTGKGTGDNDEVDETDEDDDEDNGRGDETGGGMDDREDGGTTDVNEGADTGNGGEDPVGEVSGDAIVEETGLLFNAGNLPSSTSPDVPPMFLSNCERARIADLEAEVQCLRSQLETTNSQLETVLAHSICAGWEIKSLKERLNLKTNAKKRKVQVNAQYISSADAIRILDEREREEAEKKQKEEEARAAKKAKDDQRKQQREAGGITFTGSLNNKTRDDLLDITFALQLTGPDSNTTETRATLISMINAHLDGNPHLASDSTFAGLFLSRTRGRKRNEETVTPSVPSPPTPPPPGLPRQPLSSDLTGNMFESKSEPPMVLFNELPSSGRFFQSINSTPPNFSLPGPSSFTPYGYYPPPTPPLSDPQLPSPFYFPPPLMGEPLS